jgi:aspartate kinase
MRNNPIIVQKYGGACLETPAKIRAVATSLADLHSRGHRVVAIVSAMGKTTDELVKMAYQVIPDCVGTDSRSFRRVVIHLGFAI